MALEFTLEPDPSWTPSQRSDTLAQEGYYRAQVTAATDSEDKGKDDPKPGVRYTFTIQDDDEKGKVLLKKVTENMGWFHRQMIMACFGLDHARGGGKFTGANFVGQTCYFKTRTTQGNNGEEYTDIDVFVTEDDVKQAAANNRLRWPKQVRQSKQAGGVFGSAPKPAGGLPGGVFGQPAAPAPAPNGFGQPAAPVAAPAPVAGPAPAGGFGGGASPFAAFGAK